MRSKIICLLLPALITVTATNKLFAQKKVPGKALAVPAMAATPELSPYQKLFAGKKVETQNGLMVLHKVDAKVYAEFPEDLLGKDLMLTSSIVQTSDNGEGVVGQFSDRALQFRFVKRDSVIEARMFYTPGAISTVPDSNMTTALKKISQGGIYKTLKIMATAPDGSPVIDLTPMFIEHSVYTNPFPAYALNSFYGLSSRTHMFRQELSAIKSIRVKKDNLSVMCEMGYSVSSAVLGGASGSGRPLLATINKVLCRLPEQPMRMRLADPRIGVAALSNDNFGSLTRVVEPYYHTLRRRIEPTDTGALRRGESTEPKQPVVYYLDPVMPERFRRYVREGVTAWNVAFEKIGYRNVLRVEDFPADDPDFDPFNSKYSIIRYSPTVMKEMQRSIYFDPRTGEILNSSIYINSGQMEQYFRNYASMMLGTDTGVTSKCLSDELLGKLLKCEVMRAVGKSLGLTENHISSMAYPTDSLRSATFTQKNGLAPSVMDGYDFNYIAGKSDIARGVVMIPDKIGPYDEYAIHWLYADIPAAQSLEDERFVLDSWIAAVAGNPVYRFSPPQTELYDPRIIAPDLGDDPFKGLKYLSDHFAISVKGMKNGMVRDDKDGQAVLAFTRYIRVRLYQNIKQVAAMIGGTYLSDDAPRAVPVPVAMQRRAVKTLFKLYNDLDWMEDRTSPDSLEQRRSETEALRTYMLAYLDGRIDFLMLNQRRFKNTYTISNYADDVFEQVFGSTVRRRALTKKEMALQVYFVQNVLGLSSVDLPASQFSADKKQNAMANPEALRTAMREPQIAKEILAASGNDAYEMPGKIAANSTGAARYYYATLLRTLNLLQKQATVTDPETRRHYEYLLFKINQSLSTK